MPEECSLRSARPRSRSCGDAETREHEEQRKNPRLAASPYAGTGGIIRSRGQAYRYSPGAEGPEPQGLPDSPHTPARIAV